MMCIALLMVTCSPQKESFVDPNLGGGEGGHSELIFCDIV